MSKDLVYLCIGAEPVLADRAVAKILEPLKEKGATNTQFDAPALEVGQFSDATAPSLFSGPRVVTIRDLQDLEEDAQGEVLAYCENPDPDITLIFIHKGGVKGKAFLTKLRKVGITEITCEPLKKDNEKMDFLKTEALTIGRKLTPDAARALVDAVGSDLREMISALHQLSSDSQVSGTSPITADQVAVLYSGRVEASGFAVADAAVEGRLGDALLAARQAIDTGTDPVVLVNALASVLRTLAKVGAAGRSAKSFELAGVLGLAPWQIDKARRQLPGWNGDGITTAITAIAHADSQVKGGGSDPIYALEVALVAVAGAKNG